MTRVLITQASNIHTIMALSHKKPVFPVKISTDDESSGSTSARGVINYVYDSVGWHGIDTATV